MMRKHAQWQENRTRVNRTLLEQTGEKPETARVSPATFCAGILYLLIGKPLRKQRNIFDAEEKYRDIFLWRPSFITQIKC